MLYFAPFSAGGEPRCPARCRQPSRQPQIADSSKHQRLDHCYILSRPHHHHHHHCHHERPQIVDRSRQQRLDRRQSSRRKGGKTLRTTAEPQIVFEQNRAVATMITNTDNEQLKTYWLKVD